MSSVQSRMILHDPLSNRGYAVSLYRLVAVKFLIHRVVIACDVLFSFSLRCVITAWIFFLSPLTYDFQRELTQRIERSDVE